MYNGVSSYQSGSDPRSGYGGSGYGGGGYKPPTIAANVTSYSGTTANAQQYFDSQKTKPPAAPVASPSAPSPSAAAPVKSKRKPRAKAAASLSPSDSSSEPPTAPVALIDLGDGSVPTTADSVASEDDPFAAFLSPKPPTSAASSTQSVDPFESFTGIANANSNSGNNSPSSSASDFEAFGISASDSAPSEPSVPAARKSPSPRPLNRVALNPSPKPAAPVLRSSFESRTPQQQLQAKTSVEKLKDVGAVKKQHELLAQLKKLPCNSTCADCASPCTKRLLQVMPAHTKTSSLDPDWASANLGIFICIKCAGIHRQLGTHISKVRSILLDTWTPDQLQRMIDTGNDISNDYWEANMPAHYQRPTQYSSGTELLQFMRDKYEFGRFKPAAVPAAAPSSQKPSAQASLVAASSTVTPPAASPKKVRKPRKAETTSDATATSATAGSPTPTPATNNLIDF